MQQNEIEDTYFFYFWTSQSSQNFVKTVEFLMLSKLLTKFRLQKFKNKKESALYFILLYFVLTIFNFCGWNSVGWANEKAAEFFKNFSPYLMTKTWICNIFERNQNWGRRWKSESPLIWNNGCDFRHHAWTEFKPIYISLQRPHGWLHSQHTVHCTM